MKHIVILLFTIISLPLTGQIKFDYSTGILSIDKNEKFKAGDYKTLTITNIKKSEYENIKVDISFQNFNETYNAEDLKFFTTKTEVEKGKIIESVTVLVYNFKVRNKDQLTLSIKTKVGDGENETKIIEPITGSFKVDFSAGVSVSWLNDSSYTFMPVDSASNRIVQQNKSPYTLGLVALTHAHFNYWTNIDVAITSGVKVNTEADLSLLCGLSLILGREQRYILSAGVEIGQIKLLSNEYKADRLISNTITDINQYETYKHDLFIAISYNF